MTRLNRMFESPAITCHHDFFQCELPRDAYPANVLFVDPPVPTRWGDFSVVEATVRVLEQMYAGPPFPEWVVLLSGSDYPVSSATRIRADLRANAFDAHMHHEAITGGQLARGWQRDCFERYHRGGRTPFTEDLHCFAGSQWFSVNRRAAEYIIQFHRSRPALANYYRDLPFPEESYFQTILANAPGLTLHNNDWRYADWSANGPHPKTLSIEDEAAILGSGSHFARKLDLESHPSLFDALDMRVDQLSS